MNPFKEVNPRPRNWFRSPCLVLLILVFGTMHLCAQVKVLRVMPDQTDPAMANVHGPHLALYDPQATSRHQLFLFFVGTGGKAEGGLKMASVFASWGYHAISLDYENNVVTVVSAHSKDPTSFDRYRKAIITGAPVSELIKVSSTNSILNRFQKLLVYLVKQDPQGGWDQFVQNDQPVWNKIVGAGHSQGSGHAAYLGKLFPVQRVLMFSGPQDYLDDLHEPAPWLGDQSATPPDRFYAFLAEKDPYNVHHQVANCSVLMRLSLPKTQIVQTNEAISAGCHILINNIPTKSPHGTTMMPQFKNVWEYMATNAAG